MESENSITLESCGEDSILIQTVKDMVEEDTHTELQNEEGFFVVTNVQDDQQNVIEVSNEESNEEANEEPTISQSEERFIWSNLCRVCANSNDHIIPIFEGEGLQHNLCNKIHKYLPIQVSKNDTLPLQLCYHCAATLLAWHELLEGCLNAERRLLEMQNALQEKQNLERLDASTQDTSISNVSESLHQQQETIQDGVCEESTVSDSDRWKIEFDGVVRTPTVGSERTNTEEDGYIQCAQCDIIFADMKYFIDHMNTIHQAQMYYCQYCKFMYNGQKRDFEEHISMHNSDYEESKNVAEYKSLGCVNGIKEENDGSVTSTFVTDTEQFANYTCHLCEKNFLKKSELKKHINKHSNVSRIQNPDEMELVNKAKQVINDRVSYKCDTCKKVIFTKRGFLRHIRVHSDKRPCKCDLCGKFYRIEQDLARHVRDVHEGLKKYVCDICGRAFANKGAKDDHRRIHTGERPYACEHCPKMFRTLNSIYIHNRVHTDYKPHKCSYCGKHFRSRQRLTHHETTHTGIKAFACEICGRTFSVKGEVVRHRAVHNEEKPFDCKCGMKFGQKRYLRNHIKQHHKEASSWLLAELSGNN